ncbi:hypothetical protein [Adhaeribacter rhizoryzae]|uniref:Uncharacterized protein n=1 Tax=Adhaeribacter rhizoryzae TaxID=2607907 RepID=A0A5M6D023_9BACT|nr:hypothetical protein [Adhaeribacter rhizoryzae]KAA5539642.1 hypothetical protein F0145_23945 [Adhaeribacter rhizoryzae]
MPTTDAVKPLGFPNPNLFVLYADVLRYIQYRLKILGHGQLKPFCLQHSLPYTTIVNLKNNTLKRKEHRLLQKLLAALSFETTASQNPVAAGENDRYLFLFPGQEELQQFRDQLAYIDSQAKYQPH